MENNEVKEGEFPLDPDLKDDKVEEVIKDDRHEQLADTSKEVEVDSENIKEKAVLLPAGKYKILMGLIDFINSKDVESFKLDYSEKEKAITGINLDTARLTTNDDVFCENLEKNDYVNGINYGESDLNMKHIKVKGSGTMSGSAAVAKFSSALGIGETINVPLWHSGMWVTIRPPKDTDIINLEIALSNNEIKIGRETNTLVYSNYSVIFNRIVTDFIVSHIVATSVKIPDDTDIRDLIRIQDLYTLIVGLASTIYPEGYPIIRNCKNSLEIVDDKPKCDFSVSGNVDPMKLLWVNKKVLTTKTLEHMSNKRPDSTTVAQIKEYQLSLDANNSSDIMVTSGNGVNFTLTLKSPTLASYIDNGEEWIETVTNKSEELFTDKDSEDVKTNKINDITAAVVLGVYNTYITKAELGDGTIVTDKTTLNGIIELLSSDEKVLKSFIEDIKKFIDTKAISIIATPAYTCPKCKAENVNETDNHAFKEFLPINVLEHFFDLGALRTSKIRNRSIY